MRDVDDAVDSIAKIISVFIKENRVTKKRQFKIVTNGIHTLPGHIAEHEVSFISLKERGRYEEIVYPHQDLLQPGREAYSV